LWRDARERLAALPPLPSRSEIATIAEKLSRDAGEILKPAAALVLATVRETWRLVRGPLIMALQVIAAVIVLFEEWGWRPLVEGLSYLARFRSWARLELWIAGLPPYGALAALALPTSILFPLKLVALYLLALGHAVSGGALFAAAKIASTALIARIFMLTKPALMQIAWFARAYDWLIPWQEAMFAMIRASWVWRYGRMVKTRVRLETTRAWAGAKPKLEAAWAEWRPWIEEAWEQARFEAAQGWARLKPRIASEIEHLRIAARRSWERVRGV
jgi:hypothetical protein